MLFENILAEDAEVFAVTPATLFVAFKGSLVKAARVRTKNCVCRQPTRHATIQISGYISHGNSIDYTSQDDAAENCYYGISKKADAATLSRFTLCGTFIGVNNVYSVVLWEPSVDVSIKVKNTDNYLQGAQLRANGCNFKNSWFILNGATHSKGVSYESGCTDSPDITDSYFARTTLTADLEVVGVRGKTTADGIGPNLLRNTFVNVNIPSDYYVWGCDYNTFFNFTRLRSSLGPTGPPYFYTTLSAWQTDSGQDLNSTVPGSAPTLPDGFWDLAIPDVLA